MAQDTATQASSAAVQGDIVVTAQRREQLAIKTPLSLTALDGSALTDRQVDGLVDMQFVSPGIRSGQQNGVNRLFIRGIGLSSFASGADPSVAFYVDGVYVGRPTAQLSSFYDLSRVEILRGPQGALYGRNATGGAINLITAEPTVELGGYADLTVGNYDLFQGQGAINVPLSSDGSLRARVAFNVVNRGGYGRDLAQNHDINDQNSQSFRGTLQYNPSDTVDIKLIGEYHREKDNNHYTMNSGAYPGYVLQGASGITNTDPALGAVGYEFNGFEERNSHDAATGVTDPANRRKSYALTLNAKFELTDDISLVSITGWRKFNRYNGSSSDGTSLGLGVSNYTERSKQFNQELQLNYSSDFVDVVTGVSYYHEKLGNDVKVPFPQYGSSPEGEVFVNYHESGTMKIDAFAAYIQGTFNLSPSFRVTAAGRYSTEKRTTVGSFTFTPNVIPIDDGKRWNAFTPKLGIEYDVTDSALLYASVTRGFKSGTFNVGQVNPAINPEKIWAYEAGLKARLLDNALDVTAAVFHYDYKDLQVNKILGLATLTTNAASAKNTGVEVSVVARPTPQLKIDANGTYLHGRFSSFDSINPLFPNNPAEDLKGNQLPGAPKYSFAAGVEYGVPLNNEGDITARVDVSYNSRVYFSEFNDKVISQKGVAKTNVSLKYDSGNAWTLTFWGKNIFDEFVTSNKILGIQLWGFPIYGAVDAPATYGATLGVKF